MKRIYLDYASLTPIDKRVLREMNRYSGVEYANPSSLYKEGVLAMKAMEDGRKRVADFLHAHSDEIIFTGGGTEANNLAMMGAYEVAKSHGKTHLIISAIEHSSVMQCANELEKSGVEVTRLGVDSAGVISLKELKEAIRGDTFMVSIMSINNEIGSLEPIKEIAKIVRNARKVEMYPVFHTDASQMVAMPGRNREKVNMEKTGADLLTLDGGKIYGPRGIGALYARRGTPIQPIAFGGGQEKGLRSGTENIPAIMGFAKALDIISGEDFDSDRTAEIRRYFIHKLHEIRPDIRINGTDGPDASHILNISIPGIDSEFFVLQLDARGIACSTKSTCLRDEDESYVLKAIGADSGSSVRFSFGRFTKKKHVKRAILAISEILC